MSGSKEVTALVRNTPKGEPVYLTIASNVPLLQLAPSSSTSGRKMSDLITKSPAPVMFKLPHAPRPSNLSILLVVKDPQLPAYQLLQEDADSITKGMFGDIVSISRLRSRKDKHKLSQQYDLILVDDRLTRVLPSVIGTDYYKSGKTMPIPIRIYSEADKKSIDVKAVKKQTKLALKSTALALTQGTQGSVLVGDTSIGVTQLTENINAAIDGLMGRLGSKSKHVSGFRIKTPESASIPYPAPA